MAKGNRTHHHHAIGIAAGFFAAAAAVALVIPFMEPLSIAFGVISGICVAWEAYHSYARDTHSKRQPSYFEADVRGGGGGGEERPKPSPSWFTTPSPDFYAHQGLFGSDILNENQEKSICSGCGR